MKRLQRRVLMAAVLGGLALAFPSAASAQTVTDTQNDSVPVELSVYVPCANDGAGESVLMSGRLHVLFHATANDQGLHVKYHFQPQGVSGVGEMSGDRYQGTGVTQGSFQLRNGAITATDVNNFRIAGQGPGNNLLLHANFHFTLNANGEMTAMVDNFRAECK